MRVLVLGAGATGGYYGSRLIEAGSHVDFLVRARRADLLRENGLRLERSGSSFHAPINVRTTVDANVHYDLVLLSCKAYDLHSAIDAISPAVGERTIVMPLLNGLRHLQRLDAAFGEQRVLGALCHISVTLDQGGTIRQTGQVDRLTFGWRGAPGNNAAEISAALHRMQVEAIESPQILAAMWSKFAMLSALAGITCLMRGSIGEIAATADGAALGARLYEECALVAERGGYPQETSVRADSLRTLTSAGSRVKASMLHDLERGGRTEVEHVLGDMLARARGFAIDAPLLAAACTALRVHEARRDASSAG